MISEMFSYFPVWAGAFLVLVVVVGTVSRLRRRTTKLRGWRLRVAVLAAATGLTLVVAGYDHCLGWVRTRALRKALQESTRLVIRTGDVDHGPTEQDVIAYETTDHQTIRALAESLTLRRAGTSRCMCSGDMTFDCYAGNRVHYSFSSQHQRALRIRNAGRNDWPLTRGSQAAFTQWLETSGTAQRVKLAQEEHRRRFDVMIDELLKEQAKTNATAPAKP